MGDIGSLLQAIPSFVTIVNMVILLSAIFFFTSTLASHLLEAIVGYLNSRGKQLRKRLQAVLGAENANQIYSHPLIASLSTGNSTSSPPTNPPSYIDPAFLGRVVAQIHNAKKFDEKAQALFDSIKNSSGAAAGDFEKSIVEWFNALTDRLNGVYTRWSFLRLAIIGLLFAAAMDIDTLHIAGTIWAKPEMTSAMVDEIQKAIPSLKPSDPALTEEQRKSIQAAITSAVAPLRTAAPPYYAWQKTPEGLGNWLAKILGWLLTALATSLGAQFWFNLMSEALKLRAAGPKPDTKETAGSQKPKGQ
jgi:hypothetical protein